MANLLHTKSSYFENDSYIPLNNANPQSVFYKLKAREDTFAQTLGFKNFDDMIKQIKELFEIPNLNDDIKYLQNFQANNINKTQQTIKDYIKSVINPSQPVNVTVRFRRNNYNLSDIFGKRFNPEQSSVIGTNLSFSLNQQGITKTLDTLINNQKSGNGTTSLAKRLHDNVNAIIINNIVYSIDKQNNGQDIYTFEFNDYFFNKYTPEQFKALDEDQKKIIVEEINNILFYKMGNISDSMRKSIRIILRRNFTNIDDYSFFFAGSGYLTGPLGEFQTALFLQYIKEITPNPNLQKALSALQFSDINTMGGVKGIVDIYIQGFGVQVKNYKDFTLKNKYTTIDTTLTLNQLQENGRMDLKSSGIELFLANYFFNKTIQSQNKAYFNQIIEYFSKNIAKIANYDYNGIKDTNVAYLIGGKYLVPASFLYEQFLTDGNEYKINISSAFRAKKDDEYAKEDSKGKPYFTKYWVDQNGWKMTTEAEEVYNTLMSSNTQGIKVKTHLYTNNFASILQEKYAII